MDALDPARPEHWFLRQIGVLERRRGLLYGVCIGLIAVIAFADYLTGDEVLLFVLHLLPVAILAWGAGVYAGLAGSVVATGAMLIGYVALSDGSFRTLHVWQALVSLTSNAAVAWAVAQLKSSHARVLSLLDTERRLAREDPVTGLASVRAYHERLALEVDRMRRHGQPLSLMYLDLDDFKRVNDERGHRAGDELLGRVGRVLVASVRKVDLCGRLGGDEFGILMPETDAQEAAHVAQRVHEGLLKSFREGGAAVGMSAGLATFLRPPVDDQVPISQVDALMYEAKRSGKNRIVSKTFE